MSTETIKNKEVTLLSDDELETVAGGTYHCGDYNKKYDKCYDYGKKYDKYYNYGKKYYCK